MEIFLETIGNESVLLHARVSAVLLRVFPDADSENKFSNLGFSYLFINHDRAYLGSITQREARTNAVSFSLSQISIVSLLLTSPRRLMSGYQRVVLPTSSLPARVIVTRGRRSEWWWRWRGRRESEKDKEEGERGSIVSDAGRGARSMRDSACFHACGDRRKRYQDYGQSWTSTSSWS